MLSTQYEPLRLGLNIPPKKIMVVEDDITLEPVLSGIFASIHPELEYKWVVTAEEAEQELAKNCDDYGLILADHYLLGKETGLDLFELCQERYPQIPCVIMSGAGVDKFSKIVGQNRIFPPFLSKPFFIGECKQILEGLMGPNL